MELTEREAHCIARMLQGARYTDCYVTGCIFCKYRDADEHYCFFNRDVWHKLSEATGVEFGDVDKDERNQDIPYRKFLKNSSEHVRKQFREYFDSCLKD